MNERHLLSNLSYSDLKLGHSNGNKSLPKLITDKNSISDKKRRCKKTCRFFRRRWSFNLFSMRLRKKQVHTPHLVAQTQCQNIAKIGPFGADFWRLRFYMGQFGPECYFLTFWALQDGFFRFFLKNFKFAIIISKSHIVSPVGRILNSSRLIQGFKIVFGG